MCHYIADYQLTTPKMIAAKSHGKTYLPILQHAVIHATLMTICLLLFGVNFQIGLYLFVLQLVTHFLIDVGKGRINKRFPKTADTTQKIYWQVYGLDQFLHTMVILIMSFIAVKTL